MLGDVDVLAEVAEDGGGAVEHGGDGLFEGFCAFCTGDAVGVT